MKLYSMKLYHGTPNDFDEFDTEHIGSGEGHQVHGWGLYFAADKKIATDRYAERLARINTKILAKIVITIDGVEYSHELSCHSHLDWITETMSEMANNKAFDPNEYDVVKLLMLKYRQHGDYAIRQMIERIRECQRFLDAGFSGGGKIYEVNDFPLVTDEESVKLNMDALKYIKNHDVKYEIRYPKPSVFTIEVPDDLVFANEKELISNQPENVKNILYNYQKKQLEIATTETPDYFDDIGGIEGVLNDWMNETTFGDWYDTYKVNDIYNDKDLSLLLESLGINGITYYGREDGRCYVVFNPNHIKIIEKEQI